MVLILCDTTSGIPLEQAKVLGLPLLPQIIMFGQESYRDDTEIDAQTFISKLKQATSLPKTAAPPPALYHPYFVEAEKNHQDVIVICPSAELSGTVRSATTAASEFPDLSIEIIDSQTIGGGLASLVLQAHTWSKAGINSEEITARIKALIAREQNYFVVDTLEYLFKGGRIGGAQNLFGSMLQIKPILTIKSGKVQPVESQRTKKRAHARLLDLISEDFPTQQDGQLCIMHGDAIDDAKKIASTLGNQFHLQDIPIYELPPAFLVHAGPGVLGVSYFKS
jgi:DegV family protein with EDD domain